MPNGNSGFGVSQQEFSPDNPFAQDLKPLFTNEVELRALAEEFQTEENPFRKELLKDEFLETELPAPGGGFLGESITRPPNTKERAIFFGIEGEGAGAGTRFKQGFGDPLQGAKQGLKEEFGTDVEVFFDEDLDDIVFIHPTTGKKALVNEPGFQFSDVLEFTPQGIVLIPEIAGALAGLAAGTVSTVPRTVGGAIIGTIAGAEAGGEEGGTLGAIAGGAAGGTTGGVLGAASGPVGGIVVGQGIGGYIGEQARLRIGRAIGANNLTDAEINQRAAAVAGISMISAGIFGKGAGIPTSVATRGTGPLAREIPEETLERGLEGARKTTQAIEETTSQKVKPKLSQVLRESGEQDLADAVEAAERALAKTPNVGKPLAQRTTEQSAQIREVEQALLPVARSLGFDDLDALGRTIQKEIVKDPERRIAQIEARTEAVRKQAEAAASRITPKGTLETGGAVRETLDTARTELRDVFSEQYQALRGAGALRIDISPIQKRAGLKVKRAQTEVIPSLSMPAADKKLLTEIASGEGATTLAKVQRALSILREEIRTAKAGKLVQPRNVRNLQELEKQLLKVRNDALAGNPELAAEVSALERSFAEASNRIDRSVIGEVLTRKEGGTFKVPDERVVDKILASPAGAKNVAAVMDDFPQFAGARGPIKEGIFSKYRKTVIDEETGIVNPTKHKTFVRNFKESMRPLLTEREFNLLTNAKTSAEFLKAEVKRNKKLITEINREFGLQIQKYDPSEVVAGVLSSTNRASLAVRIERLKKAMSGHPEKWADFQSAYLGRIRNQVFKTTSQRDRVIDLKRLDKILGDVDEVAALERTFGARFVEGLTVLRRATFLLERRSISPGAIREAAEGEPGGLFDVLFLRAVIAPPFSRRGRALSGIGRRTRKGTQKAMVRLMEDPGRLKEFMELRAKSVSIQRWAAFFSGIGATEFAISLTESSPASTPDQLEERFGAPGS